MSTVSLYVPPDDLQGEGVGILRYRLRHGPSWERAGWISFFENGNLVFSGGAGVRVHGGGSRKSENPQSFRLFFRRRYGLERLPAGVAFGGDHNHPLKRLILHNDARPWLTQDFLFHFVNPLGYDVARALGNITPATRPVRFYLNGHFDGVYVLTEHFDSRRTGSRTTAAGGRAWPTTTSISCGRTCWLSGRCGCARSPSSWTSTT